MIETVCVILAVGISLCWYLPCVKAQGEDRVLTKNDYLKVFFLYGLLFTCGLIILTEVTWDMIAEYVPISGLIKDVIADFFRAALLEEFFKFQGFRLAKNKLGLSRKTDYMLVAGLIGASYGMVEKAVIPNIAAVIVGLAIPLHIVWQFNQGGHYYEYEKYKAAGKKGKAAREHFFAVFVPFLIHGCWDCGLDLVGVFMDIEDDTHQLIAALLLLGLVVFGFVYTVRTIKKVRRIARSGELPAEEPSVDLQ